MSRLALLAFCLAALTSFAACRGSDRTANGDTATPSPGASAPPMTSATVASAAPAPSSTPAPPSGRVTLNAVGDLMLARDIIDLMDANGSVYPFEAVRSLLAGADITIANMEGAFTNRGSAADKYYTFRTPTGHARGLAEAGIDVVALGNNHAMDFGPEGLADTLAALDASGVRRSGAGMTDREARTPAVVEINGLRLAFLSYNAVTEATFAGEVTAGVSRASASRIATDVAEARRYSDVVIVSMHAGAEYTDSPTNEQRTLAHAAIDAGAALVLGSHPHVLQGWETYKGGLIVYSLGNFVFDLDRDDLATLGPRPFQTLILRAEIDRNGVTAVTYNPVFIDPDQNRPLPADPEQAAAIRARIEVLTGLLR